MLGILIKSALLDKVSLVWSVILPLAILIGGLYFIKDEQKAYHFFLGVLSLSAMSIGLMGGAFDYFGHKASGVLKVVAISSSGTLRFIIYYLLSRVIVTVLVLIPLIVVAVFLGLNEPVNNFSGLLIFCILLSIISVMLGIICGNIGQSASAVASISNMVLLVLIATCGLFYSLSILPNWLSSIFAFSPLEVLSKFAFSFIGDGLTWAYTVVLLTILLIGCWLTFSYE